MYLAPELMHMATTYSKHTGEQGGYTKAVDCWSLGVILYVWYVQYIYNTSLLLHIYVKVCCWFSTAIVSVLFLKYYALTCW